MKCTHTYHLPELNHLHETLWSDGVYDSVSVVVAALGILIRIGEYGECMRGHSNERHDLN